jgi:hypothetical protein
MLYFVVRPFRKYYDGVHDWPPGLNRNEVRRRVEGRLRDDGWSILEDFPWLGVAVRASKEGVTLNLMIADPVLTRLTTLITDAASVANKLRLPIVAFTYGYDEAWISASEPPNSVVLIRPSELGVADELLRTRRW